MLRKKNDILFIGEVRNRVGRRAEIGKSAPLCLGEPRFVIAVSVEDDALVVAYCRAYKLVKRRIEIPRALKLVGKAFQRLRDGGVYHYICLRD